MKFFLKSLWIIFCIIFSVAVVGALGLSGYVLLKGGLQNVSKHFDGNCETRGYTEYYFPFNLTFVDTDVDFGEHVYGEGETLKTASCTETGSVKYVCSLCGDEKTDAVAERLRGMDGILWADKTSERGVIAAWILSGDMRGIEKQTESIAAEYPMLAMATSQGIAQTWRIPAALMRLREKLAHGNVVLGGGNAHSMPTERIAQWILEQMRTAQDETWVQKRHTQILHTRNSSDVRRRRDSQDPRIAKT
ncbi:MAG: hypothetical protein MJ072_04670, partial [Clostridia bacterium]|nr:hypothetical protein [Clostridia bacterium]